MSDTIKMEDHLGADGLTDFRAYRKAQVANGEVCMTCNSHVTLFNPSGYPSECGECEAILSPEELDHSSHLRCPQCGGTWDPSDTEDYDVYGDDVHDVTCHTCGHDFEVSTMISYTFTSPPRLSEEEQKTWKEERDRKVAERRARIAKAKEEVSK